MALENLAEKIKEELDQIKGLSDTSVYIQDFDDNQDKSYIEFKANNKKEERKIFKFYSKWSKLIKPNCPEASIRYTYTFKGYPENYVRKIILEINPSVNSIEQKIELTKKVAEYFSSLLKGELKYQR